MVIFSLIVCSVMFGAAILLVPLYHVMKGDDKGMDKKYLGRYVSISCIIPFVALLIVYAIILFN